MIRGRPKPSPKAQPHASLNAASAGYFRAIQISLLKGRLFAKADTLPQPAVVIVNDVLAKRYFPGQNPIGQIRVALGAKQSDIVRMVISRAIVLYVVGLCAGLIGVLWCGHLLSGILAGVEPWDPLALGATTAVLLLAALFAAWFPARRAAAIQPSEALRNE